MTDFAIVKAGGKQYRVSTGDTVRVESLPADQGDTVTLDDVLMLSLDGNVEVGNPTINGATVEAEVVGKGRDKKVVILKFKAKTRYRRKNGHRQHYTDLRVTNINSG
ncbi:MAG: 50S ribosomal protein L21 [SAR202 cluster bacterium]|nr:MAG: 50S ribosomal protein L21 [SAR202 cluster bacterium]MCH2318501.1 50S ribosomal protein L21 [SAR202 cluster bacterium]MQF68505.1 50S ribosomal protein L21 [SAR202 cluster bacterium AD-802-K11_MRT_200m]MQG74777.1 50S ribosomal protein L21 [SAR202 cluster bacterium]